MKGVTQGEKTVARKLLKMEEQIDSGEQYKYLIAELIAREAFAKESQQKKPFSSAAQLLTGITSIWWTAGLYSVGAVLRYLFGPNYKHAMYGQYLKRTRFFLDERIVNTSHGFYGVVPRPVLEVQRQLQEEMESCPAAWFRYNSRRLAKKSLRMVAKFVGASVDNLVFIPSITSGIRTVLQSLDLHEGDGILLTNHTSGAVRMATQEICAVTNAKLLILNIAFPSSDMTGSVEYYAQDILQHYSKVLHENPSVKIVIVDAITSDSSLKIPLQRVIEVCQSHGVYVLVNADQAIGQIPMNLESLGAEFVVGSLHEWLFTPRGCAILWVSPEFHDVITSEVATRESKTRFRNRFIECENMDNTPFLAVNAAISFYLQLGGMTAINSYNSGLVLWASQMIAHKWKTEVLPLPETMRAPCMAVVRMPDILSVAYGASREGAEQIMHDLYAKYRVTTTVTLISGSLWCQLSAQVYNVKKDYQELAEKVLGLRDSCLRGYCPRLLNKNNNDLS